MTSRRDFISKLGMAGLSTLAVPAFSQEIKLQREIGISRNAAIPVNLEGFTGEALSALRFDLEVQGYEVVSQDKAEFTILGKYADRLEGRVLDAKGTRQQLLGKAYAGSAVRTLVHAFSDDVVKTISTALGKPVAGIAQTKIAFKVDTGRTSEVYVSDFDGHNAFQITRDGSMVAAPNWGPNGTTLVYTSYLKNDFPDIYSHDLRTGQRQVLARYHGTNTSPAVSPDGRRVAMVLSKSGSPDIYVADIDGSNPRQLTSTKGDESSPCWSPDGQTLCFASRESGRAALYTVPAGGGTMRRLSTSGVVNATEPDWSPDGSTIIFTSLYAGGFSLFTVPASGGAAALLVPGEDASWAPNSRTVVFVKRSGSARTLSLLDVPTKHVKDIKLPAGSGSQPSWAR